MQCYTGFEAERDFKDGALDERVHLITEAALTVGSTGDEMLGRLRERLITTDEGADVCEHFFAHVLDGRQTLHQICVGPTPRYQVQHQAGHIYRVYHPRIGEHLSCFAGSKLRTIKKRERFVFNGEGP